MENIDKYSKKALSETLHKAGVIGSRFKPILFSTPMVQAILEGRKTQTRRTQGLSDYNKNPDLFGVGNVRINGYFNFFRLKDEKGTWAQPKYQPGDILWVRETFFDCTNFKKFSAFSEIKGNYCYKADFGIGCHKWKPSIFMPKDACRIFLKVTDVRVERLQDISEEDSISEGIKKMTLEGCEDLWDCYTEFMGYKKAKESFKSLWNSINKNWDINPFVWVYTFKQIERPHDFL